MFKSICEIDILTHIKIRRSWQKNISTCISVARKFIKIKFILIHNHSDSISGYVQKFREKKTSNFSFCNNNHWSQNVGRRRDIKSGQGSEILKMN